MPNIRLATPADGAAAAAIYRPAVTDSAISFELTPPDAETMAERIAATLSRTPWLVFENDGGVLGYAYGGRWRDRAAYQWSAEVTVYVHRDARRIGVGRALYTSLFAVLALQGYRNAYAGITLPNAASVGVHQAVGFTLVGVYRSVGYKFGAWHDVAWYERQLLPHDSDPQPPIPLPQLLGSAELERAVGAGGMRGGGG